MDGLLTKENVNPLLEDDEFLVVEALEVELQHGGLAEGSRAARGQCTVFLKYSNHQQAQHSGTHTLLIWKLTDTFMYMWKRTSQNTLKNPTLGKKNTFSFITLPPKQEVFGLHPQKTSSACVLLLAPIVLLAVYPNYLVLYFGRYPASPPPPYTAESKNFCRATYTKSYTHTENKKNR